MNATSDPLVRDYLRTVERGLAPLPRTRRAEILADLREHLDAALAGEDGEAAVRNALDRLGDPAEVAAAARAEAGITDTAERPWLEYTGVFLVGPGSLLPVAGWLTGIVLVWASSIWTRTEKVFATLSFPLGWGGTLLLFSAGSRIDRCIDGTCSSPLAYDISWKAYLLASVMGPLLTVVVLLRGLQRHRAASAL